LIEEDTGGGWKVVPSPNAPNEAGSALNGVTCLGPRDCIAVGNSMSSASTPKTLIEQNVGDGWTIVPSPNSSAFEGVGSLSGVTCANPSRCVAVGGYESENGHFQTLIEENTGHGWTVVPSQNSSPGEDNLLTAVSCSAQPVCVAVGYSGLGKSLPLMEQNSGSGWTLVPASGVGQLSGVACPSARFCVATGGDFSISDKAIAEAPLIEEMTDGKWLALAFPHQAGTLGGVACPNPTYCMSVGDLYSFGTSAGSPLLVAERTSNGWTIGVTSDFGNQAETFGAVACAGANRCIAVGDQLVGPYPGVRTTFIALHTSQGWTIQASPNVA
jgi:hypothetical protein